VAIVSPGSIATSLAGSRSPSLFRGGTFPDGVMSGDPTSRAITLWTRLDDVSGRGAVRLEVARDRNFRRVVARENIATSAGLDHTVKARVGGLDPHERYYYRFETRGGESRVGRFQTALPSDSRETVRFGVFSCQEYTFGYFNAHRAMAREDLDFVINLGDYIYSDVALGPPTGVRSGDFQTSEGRFSAFTREEYRQVYRIAHSDPDLQDVHARFPMISTWDDHEVQNDYSGADPAGGTTTGDPYDEAKRNRAYGVFFEQMPTYPVRDRRGRFRLYHAARFGRTVDLFVLDERQYRDRNPCGNRAGPACDEVGGPDDFLGDTQLSFVRGGITRSRAAWKVIANEVPIMPLKRSDTEFDNFDVWHAFPTEREALLRTIRGVDDVVFVTGDQHCFISGDVQTADGRTVASEFVGGSISSSTEPEINAIIGRPGFGTPDDPQFPAEDLARRKAANPWFDDFDPIHHGYFTCQASSRSFRTTFKKLETVRRRSTALAETRSWTIRRGQRGLDR
jgi:alkaline phosphatase D